MADDLAGVDQGELAAVLGAPHSDGGRDLVCLHRIRYDQIITLITLIIIIFMILSSTLSSLFS